MSFKRDGDDTSLLKNLNDQRVRELLGSHVPQDEAKLLSNGRLTCLICVHRPVFDTINMLANHRRGKRHLSELSKHIKCKEEAERRQLQNKDQKLLLGSKHVEAKHNVLKHQRKHILEIRLASKTKLSVQLGQGGTEKKAATTVKHYLKKMTRKTSLEKVVERNRENYGIDLQHRSLESCVQERLPKTTPVLPLSTGTRTTSRSDIQDYEMKLRMTGWIKDLTGNWIKDPNVEFDSDEEDTPPPPP